jgi:preprotein translocase subunit SecA
VNGTGERATLPPMPGVVWGEYPQRIEALAPRTASAIDSLAQSVHAALAGIMATLKAPLHRAGDARLLQSVRAEQAAWSRLDEAQRSVRLTSLRARLARDGWAGAWRAEALGCVADAGLRSLGRDPFDSQLLAASVLLDDHLAEMATGEGKTYAAALAAAVASLAGVPVHVMTANDYLVARDTEQLKPFFAALGLTVGAVLGASDPDARRAAYACHVTYCTAREVAFDYLRDGLAAQAAGSDLLQRTQRLAGRAAVAPRLLRGLCMALLDEADSLLIDEATMPLVLSQEVADPQQRASCFQALTLARQLKPGVDVTVNLAARRIEWLEPGVEHLERLSTGLHGAWCNRQHRRDMVGAALEALHLLERDQHYIVRDDKVELLDAVTGRAAPGRVWSRGLQTLVELKEGCTPKPATETRAQISFQRFFARYLRLCGMSGTLAEARGEIRALYRREVVAIPLRRASLRRILPQRLFIGPAQRWQAVLRRVAALSSQGRPVLIGTDSVADSEALSAVLVDAGIAHQVLNARHDQAEAQIVAMAGTRGAVTVATRMAGRGTDIVVGDGVAALGGLHVICCQHNPSRRLDRQLIGRAARQGDPGSAETFRTLEALGINREREGLPSALLQRCRIRDDAGALALPAWLVRSWAARLQAREEARQIRQRRRLLEQDREWERRLSFSSLHA